MRRSVRHAIGDTADYATAVRVSTQDNVGKLLPADQVADVGNVCFEVCSWREEMMPVGNAG